MIIFIKKWFYSKLISLGDCLVWKIYHCFLDVPLAFSCYSCFVNVTNFNIFTHHHTKFEDNMVPILLQPCKLLTTGEFFSSSKGNHYCCGIMEALLLELEKNINKDDQKK